ncbi:MAG: hypothetical protein IGS49_03200 [Chlorogloeopsis fritschii C42_A2020_084]|nr:hypothetical protein [Chlorogloeopsis fritschii C42_A2020_084]
MSKGDRSLPKVTRHSIGGGEHREAHNIYGLLQAQAAYESLRQYRPHQRPFIVSRTGWVDDTQVTSQGNWIEWDRFSKG